MRRLRIGKYEIQPTSLRLALSYLAIIMVLSLGFSTIFYVTSMNSLNIQVQKAPLQTAGSTNGNDAPIVTFVGGGQPVTTTTHGLNEQLQERIASVRLSLIQELVALNIAAFVVSALISYYLARRTLRPIEQAMEAQSRFASDASHELRTPLAIMQTEIEVVLNNPRLTVERAKAALESNRQEVTRMRTLSEGLLRLAQSSRGEVGRKPVALDSAVNEAINQVANLAIGKDITITDTVPRISIEGDMPSIVQALVILLDNAIKYSPKEHAVYVTGRAEGKHVYLSIRDEGPGIRASDLPHIFERFYRADQARAARDVEGYGLGLSIAKKIVEQHHGVLTATSALGEGATFTLKFPKRMS